MPSPIALAWPSRFSWARERHGVRPRGFAPYVRRALTAPARTARAARARRFPRKTRHQCCGLDKPKNALGMVKDLPASEMERLMLAAIVATEGDLRLLARQRAQVAREQILRGKRVETERVFLIEPKSLRPAHKDKVRECRVDFRLQQGRFLIRPYCCATPASRPRPCRPRASCRRPSRCPPCRRHPLRQRPAAHRCPPASQNPQKRQDPPLARRW